MVLFEVRKLYEILYCDVTERPKQKLMSGTRKRNSKGFVRGMITTTKMEVFRP